MISYQQRSGDKAVENESTQKNSHFCAARNTKPRVGMSEPPSLALLADSEAITPSISPVPKVSGCVELCMATVYETKFAAAPPTPGMIPTKVPIADPLKRPRKWWKTSFIPCPTPFVSSWPVTLAAATAVFPLTVRFIISASAKTPMTKGISCIPSHKYTVPKLYRISPVITLCPTKDNMIPNPPANRPFKMFPWAATTMAPSPNKMNINVSGAPNAVTAIRINGKAKIKIKTPNTAPAPEAVADMPRALPASPFCAIGYPSKQVAAFTAVPGALIIIALIEPPTGFPPIIPAYMNIACSGSIPNVRGSTRPVSYTHLRAHETKANLV